MTRDLGAKAAKGSKLAQQEVLKPLEELKILFFYVSINSPIKEEHV